MRRFEIWRDWPLAAKLSLVGWVVGLLGVVAAALFYQLRDDDLARRGIVRVPIVTGLDVEAARAEIRSSGLVPGPICYVTNEFEEGVLAQTPPPGTEARRGAAVRLMASRGLLPMTPPHCFGRFRDP